MLFYFSYSHEIRLLVIFGFFFNPPPQQALVKTPPIEQHFCFRILTCFILIAVLKVILYLPERIQRRSDDFFSMIYSFGLCSHYYRIAFHNGVKIYLVQWEHFLITRYVTKLLAHIMPDSYWKSAVGESGNV